MSANQPSKNIKPGKVRGKTAFKEEMAPKLSYDEMAKTLDEYKKWVNDSAEIACLKSQVRKQAIELNDKDVLIDALFERLEKKS